MFEFIKNLFFKKKDYKNVIEMYTYDEDIRVFINRDKGLIKIETPKHKELTREQIVDICTQYYP